jgi:UDP-glucose 4-epimerase
MSQDATPTPGPAAAPGAALPGGPDGEPARPPAPRPDAPAAVIGAGGFLGSALVPVLQSAGVPVTAFTRKTPFLTDSGAPNAGLLAARTVFWLASSINPAIAEAEPGRVHEDRETFVALLRAVERLADPPRVVLVSSGGTVYDPAEPPPYREDSPTRPRGAYGRAKLDLEHRLLAAELHPGRAVVARVSNAYGPGQPAASGQGVIAYWLRAVAAGDPITIFGDPATTRDYVYVDDIAGALLAMHRHPGALPPVVNVGSGRPTALAELAELVRAAAGRAATVRLAPARGFDLPHSWLDVRLAADLLGWRPPTGLPAGIAAAWRWTQSSA